MLLLCLHSRGETCTTAALQRMRGQVSNTPGTHKQQCIPKQVIMLRISYNRSSIIVPRSSTIILQEDSCPNVPLSSLAVAAPGPHRQLFAAKRARSPPKLDASQTFSCDTDMCTIVCSCYWRNATQQLIYCASYTVRPYEYYDTMTTC